MGGPPPAMKTIRMMLLAAAHRWRALSLGFEDEGDIARMVAGSVRTARASPGAVERGVRNSRSGRQGRRQTVAHAQHRAENAHFRNAGFPPCERAATPPCSAVAADKFLAGMAERLQSEFGIAASTVRALAVTARLPASDVGDGSDDEAQHMPGGLAAECTRSVGRRYDGGSEPL